MNEIFLANGCEFNGKFYKFGATWIENWGYNGFKYECSKKSTRAEIVACITHDGDEMLAESMDIKNGMKRLCVRRGDTVLYEDKTVGAPPSSSAIAALSKIVGS